MAVTQRKEIKTPSPEEATTPLMAQYLTIKAEHPSALLFFRLGDFYELFFEDAIKASRALDITLTRRGQMNGQDVPMCGVPFHAHESYMAKLIRQGFHVALCEQTENPAEAKKRGGKSIVTREVVRIVTKGTVTEDSLLNSREANYLACVCQTGEGMAVAWIDLANGEPCTEKATPDTFSTILARINPSEILISQKLVETADLFESLMPWKDVLTPQPATRFDSDNAHRRVLKTYHISDLAAFGDFSRTEIASLGALLDYVTLTQKSDISHIQPPRSISFAPFVAMDPSTRRNLELTRTLAGERKGSLLDAIDRTVTSAGARLLATRLSAPLTECAAIEARLNIISYFLAHRAISEKIRNELSDTPDLERSLSRLALERGGPRDLAAVREALFKGETIRSTLLSLPQGDIPAQLKAAITNLGEHSFLTDKLSRALKEDLPLLARDGGFIARGYAAQLDELLMLRDDSRRLIAGLQQNYINAAGVPALKIKHNNVIGYYIEVTPTHAEKLMEKKELFIHRQTMAGGVRFSTVELSELERKISEAADKACALELALFADLVKDIIARLMDLQRCSAALAEIDVSTALTELACEQNYTRPVIDDSLTFIIKDGRHPVVEQSLRRNPNATPFIGNGCDLGSKQRLWLLTGPNMAGKSTFLRQNALIALLAQTGSFVPASAAHIGMIDRLFSRVGAADDLARGQSTFMVEMIETAAILNQASKRALVILDEIGRGTATYDGLSIAWATIEHLHEVNQCRTLFATHYHELTALTQKLPALFCATMKIKEWEKEIIFLHEVISGTADRSYGIHVAQMAGLPKSVISRAQSVLHGLETGETGNKANDIIDNLPLFSIAATKMEQKTSDSPILTAIRDINPDDLTPKEALEALYKLKALE